MATTQQNYTPDQELERLKSDSAFAGGSSYGRTPAGIVDLKTGTVVSNTANLSTDPAASTVRRYADQYQAPTTGTYSTEAERMLKANAATPIVTDENAIRQKMRENVQSQIDTIKAVAADRIATEKVAGENRSGQTRAVNARSGTIGQDFGNAAQEKTTTLNAAAVKAIENQRDMEIQSILTKVDSDAYQRSKDATELAKKNATDYVNYLKEKRDSARTDIATLAKGGMTLDKLTEQQYKNLLDASEMTPSELNAAFVLNKPQETVVHSFTEGNKYYVITKDPITGKNKTETIDLGFSVPKNYNQTKVNDNTVLFFPDKFDETKPIKDQILTYSVGGGKATTGTGAYVKGADPTVDSWADRIANGKAKITDIPASQAALRNKVQVALSTGGSSLIDKPAITELGKQALTAAESLLSKINAGEGVNIIGSKRNIGGGLLAKVSGSKEAALQNDFNNLKSILSLEGAKYLKGSGQISDSERKLLADAVTKLNLTQDIEEFRKTLQDIIFRFKGVSSDQNTAQTAQQDGLTEEQRLLSEGYSPEQIKAIKEAK